GSPPAVALTRIRKP
ncbi:hypothetical protein ECFRIK2001_0390, partial [Escherichia coli FRIK2001]